MKKIDVKTAKYFWLIFEIVLCILYVIYHNRVDHISDSIFLCPQTSAQQALTGTINSSMQAVQAAQASLDDFDTLPPLGTDAVSLSLLSSQPKWIDLNSNVTIEQF